MTERYSYAQRLLELRTMFDTVTGATYGDIETKFDVSRHTAMRLVAALEQTGAPLTEELVDKRKVFRIEVKGRTEQLQFTVSQLMALFLARESFGFLKSTGLREDLEHVFDRVKGALTRRRAGAVLDIERKPFDVNEHPYDYEDMGEMINEILTALTRNNRVLVTRHLDGKEEAPFAIDPYTLVVYKKGLYLAGYSHHHKAIRSFGLDGVKTLECRKGDKFEYPTDYHPSQLVDGAWGLIGGEETDVLIHFSLRVVRYVKRRKWHPTQQFKKLPRGGVAMRVTVNRTKDLVSWVLSFGDLAEIREPSSLRAKMRDTVAGLAEFYED